jgi:hypothetical protein
MDKDFMLNAPNKDGNVWPDQCCPVFSARNLAPLNARECWYCSHADFHLTSVKPLEVGICCWPRKVISE